MKIALIQCAASHDTEENLQKAEQAVAAAASFGADLACFPELAFTRFYPQKPADEGARNLAEPIPGPTTERFSALAKKYGMVLVLNLFERDGDHCFDTSPVIDADGRLLGKTRMVHITDYPCFHEKGYYDPGDTGAPVYDTRAGKIGVAICYDRHFPEYMRALALRGADLVVVPQAGAVNEWPEGLFEGEMRTAAFQNGYFIALCNRVGEEERLTFAGESFVTGPDGIVRERAEGDEAILYANVDLSETSKSHARRLFFADRRPNLYAGFVSS